MLGPQDEDAVASAAKSLLMYCFAVGLVRAGALRLVGRLSSLDVLVGFMLGSLLSRGVTGPATLEETAAACVMLVVVHWVVTTLAFHSERWGRWLKRPPVQLVKDGVCLRDNMRRARVSEGDLLEGLRHNGMDRASQARCAYLERDGEISAVRREEAR